jgi:hypothetical protein
MAGLRAEICILDLPKIMHECWPLVREVQGAPKRTDYTALFLCRSTWKWSVSQWLAIGFSVNEKLPCSTQEENVFPLCVVGMEFYLHKSSRNYLILYPKERRQSGIKELAKPNTTPTSSDLGRRT